MVSSGSYRIYIYRYIYIFHAARHAGQKDSLRCVLGDACDNVVACFLADPAS